MFKCQQCEDVATYCFLNNRYTKCYKHLVEFNNKQKAYCVCGRIAKYGLPNHYRVSCYKCKLPSHINLANALCFCGKPACYGLLYDKKKLTCRAHKLPNYVRLYTDYCECGKIANFGSPIDKKRIVCFSHRLPGYINLTKKVTKVKIEVDYYEPTINHILTCIVCGNKALYQDDTDLGNYCDIHKTQESILINIEDSTIEVLTI